jgi:hypothetical protein
MRRKFFFFEKKEQKTFDYLQRASPDTLGLVSQEFFASFFQKRSSSLLEEPAA